MSWMKTPPLETINKFLEGLSYIVVILGVPVFFYQMHAESNQRQSEQTLAFISRFQEEGISTTRAELFLPWTDYADEIRALNAGTGMPQSMLDRWVDRIVESSVKRNPDHNLLQSIHAMTDFFDQLHLCIATEVCEKKTARRYFRAYAVQFQALYGRKVEALREDLALGHFGKGLDFIAEKE